MNEQQPPPSSLPATARCYWSAAAARFSRRRFQRRTVAMLLVSIPLVGGSSLPQHKALAAISAAEQLPDIRRAPIPVSPQQWQVPSKELIRRNRANLTQPVTKEFLRNGGFETSAGKDERQPRHWGRLFWGHKGNSPEVAKSAVVRSSERSHRGQYALKINSNFGNDDAGEFAVSQGLPADEIKGKRIRYTLWSYLETHPHPDMDAVAMRVRQRRDGQVIRSDRIRIAREHGRWQQGEFVLQILESADRVDVTASIANTHYSSRPTVAFLDDLSLTLAEDELLAVALPAPEQAKEAGVLPIECRITDDLRSQAPFTITHFVKSEDTSLGAIRLSVDRTFIRSVISLGVLQPGAYELVSILTLPKLGPVAMVRNSFLVYDGPFGRDQ